MCNVIWVLLGHRNSGKLLIKLQFITDQRADFEGQKNSNADIKHKLGTTVSASMRDL